MKTAMQNLIEELKYVEDSPMISGIIKRAYILLKKEKKQMLDFGLYVKKNGWVGCKIEDMFEDYNNQNK